MANPEFVPAMSTNEIYRDTNTTRCLTDDLDAIESDISDVNTALSGKAAANHTHEPSTIGAALATHSHYYAELSGMPEALAEKADVDHTHTGYADADHTHSEYASTSHYHTGYASSGHTHSEYADADHEHDEYFNANTGGSIGGTTNVNGVFRVQGQQMIYFDDNSNSQTFGTNNATGGTTICCGPSATAAVNGAYLKTPTILPRSTNTYSCGNANFRWNGIYSTAAVNVSSDIRMKRDIAPFSEAVLADFVNGLNVVAYNYKNDPEDMDPRIGLIAQDVLKVDSDIAKFFVSKDEDGMLSLKPADLVFALIGAVQVLAEKVEELSNK